MTFYISHLFDDDKTKEVIDGYKKDFNIGIETIDFAAGYFLDMKDDKVHEYDKRMGVYIKDHSLSIHGPFLDLCPHSFDSAIRKATMQRYEETYRAAKLLGAKRIVFHSCLIPSVYYGSTWEDNNIDFWKEFLSDKDDSVKIHIENVYESVYENLKNLIDRVGNPLLSICLDIGHAFCFSKIPIEEWINELGNRIGHVHIHNNDGSSDQHLPLEDGKIDMNKMIDLCYSINEKMEFTIEMNSYDDSVKSLEFLKKCKEKNIKGQS